MGATYLDKAKGFYNQFEELQGRPSEFSWDDKTAGAQILMWELTEEDKYKANVQEFLDYLWTGDFTPKGLVWISSSQWGSLRHAGNLAFIALQAAKSKIDADNCVSFALNQINYILGDTGRSFVCGWGAFNNPGPNPQTLNGALVGGPDHSDNYNDDR